MTNDKIELARTKAIEVLRACAKPTGFYASGLPGGYEATWSRDSNFTAFGASLIGTEFQETIAKSLRLLAANQSDNGLIPNCVGSWNDDRQSFVTFNSIDAPQLFIIGCFIYREAYPLEKGGQGGLSPLLNEGGVGGGSTVTSGAEDIKGHNGDIKGEKGQAAPSGDELFAELKPNIIRAFTWLRAQDPNEDTLLAQQPTMDWEDAFPHKYGHVTNTQALWYAVLKLIASDEKLSKDIHIHTVSEHNENIDKTAKLAEHMKKVVNGDIEKYLSLWDEKRGYYLPWNWKNHDGDREHEEYFDSLANAMAILFDLAKPEQAERIVAYVEKHKINRPYPMRCIWPPIKPGDKEWHSYFSKSDAREPNHYLNGGIWPFIGSVYVAALVKMGEYEKAEKELAKVADGVMKRLQIRDMDKPYEFNEWIDPDTEEPMGEPYQAWSAGVYIYAYECVKQKKIIYFDFK